MDALDRGTKLLIRQRGRGVKLRKLLEKQIFDDLGTINNDLIIGDLKFEDSQLGDEGNLNDRDIIISQIEPDDNVAHQDESPEIDPQMFDQNNDEEYVSEVSEGDIDQKVNQQTLFGNQDLERQMNYDDIDTRRYNFKDLPIRQLSSSITSVTTIDVLRLLFVNLFENNLIPQATIDFKGTDNIVHKLLYKLDVRIFESVVDGIVNDFKDIMDINVSNNELCYQLKKIVKVREENNEDLVKVRNVVQKLRIEGEYFKVKKEQKNINKKIKLNEKLNKLNNILLNNNKEDSDKYARLNVSKINRTEAHDIKTFSRLMDPYNGRVARIQKINNYLQNNLSRNYDLISND
ncbi:hypothetical protein TPHA_0B02710 [Tetrapisispora phaffii CBS 4417]|uniref:Inner kinetochore subunit AME1 domain-containing protein n=1 Tax=Tetrapisispora phaffii (strain ATCC 24235 / CBS 4417 / NBRC 1672 / NRRL Y-8282 / UCD 70-5) TaxID=1071381 RepID=G8BPL2_TETPH|nr:hypothetical protein TPHA_0B02710 [Tetrapisispora phaffii CBS 4417]CCE61943.1 hypothetical protein TPHA_0B02710 [Tetrapisispora phaffii CBS 4417]